MKLRSSGKVPSRHPINDDWEGKSDDSDAEDYVPPTDSDNDVGEDSGIVEEGIGVEILDTHVEASDADYEEFLDDEKKRSRLGSKKTRGRQNLKDVEVGIEEVEDEEVDVEIPEVEQHEFDVETNQKITKRRKKGEPKPTLMWEIWEEENERFIDENFYKDTTDLDNHNEIVNETAEASSDLIIPLLRYQKEWLAWALKQEDSAAKGGILADEMGMGKTIQAIALVLAKRKSRQDIWEPFVSSSSPSSSTVLRKLNCTLVICPVVAVSQWVNEINRFTTKGSTKVLVYHGANRAKSLHQFSEYDFVVTTFSIIENEYRKYLMPPKTKCAHCGKLFHEKKLKYHLRYFCGPNAVRTEKQSKQQRKQKLKIVDQATESAKGKAVQGYTGKGISRKTLKQDKKETDAAQDSLSKKPILHSIKWDRIILDEAHSIKDRQCNTAKGVFALESSYKWALSGTPLQNRVGELYSLVRFLQVVPYSFYMCKDCDCRILDYRPASVCSKCPHKSVRHFCWWNKYVANPITSEGNDGSGRRAMILLRHKLLKSILLRRTKKGRAADLALPPRTVFLRRDTLDIKEEDYYESLYNESQAQFNTYVQEGTLMNNYAHIFDLLTRLRQAVDHPYLVVYSRTAAIKMGRMVDTDDNEQVCGICNESAQDAVVTACEHVFCKECLMDYSDTLGQVSCPSCSKPLTVDLTSRMDTVDQNTKTSIKGFKSSSILNRIRLDDFQTSTKIDALREEIRFMIERDGSAKGIVFSQFTSFLDLINYSLQKSGVTCVQLVGSMSMAARDAAIARFTEDPDCKIFLMSLKAGGVALNLTVASHVFLMDPWWNPAVERQAQDRIHRIGQYKPIRIVRFVIENTIEERILKLQEKKELVFEGTVGGSSEALGRLTAADLRFLFD